VRGIAVVHPTFFLTFTFILDAPLHENPIVSYIYGGEPAYIRRRSNRGLFCPRDRSCRLSL